MFLIGSLNVGYHWAHIPYDQILKLIASSVAKLKNFQVPKRSEFNENLIKHLFQLLKTWFSFPFFFLFLDDKFDVVAKAASYPVTEVGEHSEH